MIHVRGDPTVPAPNSHTASTRKRTAAVSGCMPKMPARLRRPFANPQRPLGKPPPNLRRPFAGPLPAPSASLRQPFPHSAFFDLRPFHASDGLRNARKGRRSARDGSCACRERAQRPPIAGKRRTHPIDDERCARRTHRARPTHPSRSSDTLVALVRRTRRAHPTHSSRHPARPPRKAVAAHLARPASRLRRKAFLIAHRPVTLFVLYDLLQIVRFYAMMSVL